MFVSRLLVLALALALIGCATSDRLPVVPPPTPTPPIHVSEVTWWQIEGEIKAASLAAVGLTKDYARSSIEKWRGLVRQRTEADFIPWFTGYWTQQWLAIKMAWYKLNAGDMQDQAVRRLTTYLQEQYSERVLSPAAKEVDPDVVRAQATSLYVRLLGEQLRAVPRRYGLPQAQFDDRLKNIPAIALARPSTLGASVYDLVDTEPVAGLPAYVALLDQIREDASEAGSGPMDSSISPVAKRASEKLVAKLANSGGAGAAAAAFGGVAGAMISLAAAGFGAIAHERQRPEMEAQLRQSLNAAADEMWLSLLENPATGVMAGVHHISGQIEDSIADTLTQPVTMEPSLQGIPLRGNEPSQDDTDKDDASAEHRKAEDY